MCYPKRKSLSGFYASVVISFFLFSLSAFAQIHLLSDQQGAADYSQKIVQKADSLKIDIKLHKLQQNPLSEQMKKIWPLPVDAQKYSSLSVEGLPQTTSAGAAQVQYFSFLVQAKKEELKVFQTVHQETFLPGVHPAPAAKMPCRCADETTQWVLDEKKYFTQGQQLVEWESLGDFRGTEILRITIKPLQAGRDGLRVVSDFTVELEGVEGLFEWEKVWSKTQQKNLALIAPEALMKEMGEFISAKEAVGFRVHQVIYSGESAVELTNTLTQLHQKNALDYAIIVGSEEQVATHYVRTSADWNTPSDRPYFSFGGPRDRVPDVIYSRLVADNAQELATQLEKIREYESRSYVDDRGINTSMVVASNEGANPTDFEYAQAMLSPLQNELGWTPSYLFQGTPEATAINIIQRLNFGVEWFDYIGHGEGDRWPSVTGEALTTEHFKEIQSQGVKPIVIDVACQNGRMTRDQRIGVELMTLKKGRSPAGAVAYFGGSVDITWHPPAAMAVHISELRASRRYEGLGELLFASQMKLLETFDDIVAASENLDWYHLQGDPTMVLQD